MAITRSVKKPRKSKDTEPADAEAFITAAEPPPDEPDVSAVEEAPTEQMEATIPASLVSVTDRPQTANAMRSIRRHMPWAAGAGLLPFPGIDLAGIAVVQLHMMAELADHYGVPFKRDAAKSVAATLMAMLLERSVAGGFGSLVKLVPGAGTLLGAAVLPGIAAGGTYALGRVFVMHFESGGTFLNFDPAKAEAHFRSEFERAPR